MQHGQQLTDLTIVNDRELNSPSPWELGRFGEGGSTSNPFTNHEVAPTHPPSPHPQSYLLKCSERLTKTSLDLPRLFLCQNLVKVCIVSVCVNIECRLAILQLGLQCDFQVPKWAKMH